MLRDPFPPEVRSAATLRRRLLAIVLVAGVVVALTLVSGLDWLWFFMYASMPAGIQLPARIAVPIMAGLTLVELTVGATTAGWLIAGRIALPVAAVGLGMIGVARLVDTVRELRAARTELARLAVAEERLRFARDLHDRARSPAAHMAGRPTCRRQQTRWIVGTA